MNARIAIFVILILVLILGPQLIEAILLNRTGGISGLIKMVGIGLAIIAFLKPRLGIYIVAIETGYLDYVKKLAVYYGVISHNTIIEVLAMSMLGLGCLVLGTLMSHFLSGRKLKGVDYGIILITILLAGFFFFSIRGSSVAKIQSAINGGGYLCLALVASLLYSSIKEATAFLRNLFWILFPWTIMGIKQYYVGFSDIEYYYGGTGLSLTGTLLREGNHRVIGFGSGSPAFGIVGYLNIFCLWHVINFRHKRILYILALATCFTSVIVSEQRTILVLPIIFLVAYFIIKSKPLSLLAYASTVLAFILLVAFSEKILDNMDNINAALDFGGEWGDRVLHISTYSERIYGLKQLKDPESWTLFGFKKGGEELTIHDKGYSHNVLTEIIFRFGILGFIVLCSVGILVVSFFQKLIWASSNQKYGSIIRYCYVVYTVSFFLALSSGSNMHTNPYNMWLAWHAGALAVCYAAYIKSKEANANS